MPEKRSQLPMHSVTFRFAGPIADKLAEHLFTNWLDGGLDEVWEEALDDADIAESITYDWDPETRTFFIEAVAEEDEEDEEDEKSDEVEAADEEGEESDEDGEDEERKASDEENDAEGEDDLVKAESAAAADEVEAAEVGTVEEPKAEKQVAAE